MPAVRLESVSRWWRPKEGSLEERSYYEAGWLSESGAPYRRVIDLDGVVHFMLGDPKAPTPPTLGHSGFGYPGHTGCTLEFQWKDSAQPGFREPQVMTPVTGRAPITCILCLGAF